MLTRRRGDNSNHLHTQYFAYHSFTVCSIAGIFKIIPAPLSPTRGAISLRELVSQRGDGAAKVWPVTLGPYPRCFADDRHGHPLAFSVAGQIAFPGHHDDFAARHG